MKASEMPANGMLSKKSKLLYGKRKDNRPEGWTAMMNEIKPVVRDDVHISSDQNPHYSHYVKKYLPGATHFAVKGLRGRNSGQGELKAGGFDPLYALNHVCARVRDCINTFVRKTWSTSKKIESLRRHLMVFMVRYNGFILYQNLSRADKEQAILSDT
jgi:hypothetical protein